jgi:hypothetical protein
MNLRRMLIVFATSLTPTAALCGPPYISDDPNPTDYEHFEIYAFAQGTVSRDGDGGAAGIDFNYGATPDIQLTAAVPVAFEDVPHGDTQAGIGNIELAVKYRVAHQDDLGWDIAVFPRLFLPSASSTVGDPHASFFLPVWLEKDFGKWSTFGGGGCELNNGGDSQNFCLAGWALARQVLPNLQLGAEIVHQTADTKGGHASTAIGAGLKYDITDNYHVLAYAGPGLQNASETGRYNWYTSILFTF